MQGVRPAADVEKVAPHGNFLFKKNFKKYS